MQKPLNTLKTLVKDRRSHTCSIVLLPDRDLFKKDIAKRKKDFIQKQVDHVMGKSVEDEPDYVAGIYSELCDLNVSLGRIADALSSGGTS